jgi:predicted SAM-dependent methyltransferase
VSLWTRFVRRIRSHAAASLAARGEIPDAYFDTLPKVQPDRAWRVIQASLSADALRKRMIEAMLRDHGETVLEGLSDDQKMRVLNSLCDARLVDVIAVINTRAGGGFKYSGTADEIRIIIGSGPQRIEGWLSTDIQHLNIAEESSWRRLFTAASIDRILAEHVLEHLSWSELRATLGHVFRYLKPGGRLRLAVPDAFHPSRYYYNLVKPGGWETPEQHHLMLDCEMLSRVAIEGGFQIRLLEYFDEAGVFHSTDYDPEDGVVQRCAKHNVGLDVNDRDVMAKFYASIPAHLRQQFFDRGMTYTSLIADLVKPK